MKPEVILMAIDYGQLQRWLETSGFTQGKHTSSWPITQALFLYYHGLSLCKVARDLEAPGIPRSHVAVWKWIQELPAHLPIWASQEGMPKRIVVDWTWLQVGSKNCWIFSAIDPKTCVLTSPRKCGIIIMKSGAKRGVGHGKNVIS